MESMLFSPLTIRGLTLRNRIVLSPMLTYSAVNGYTNDTHLAHLAKFAVGGAGLVFVEATKTFIEKPDLAEKYVREQVFKGQLSSQDFRDSMENADYTYDMPRGHMQITADLMHKYGLGKMNNPPKSDAEWVKLDLLEKAKTELGAKTN